VAKFRLEALNHLFRFSWKAAVAAYEVKKKHVV
jgi:hypothetical protein